MITDAAATQTCGLTCSYGVSNLPCGDAQRGRTSAYRAGNIVPTVPQPVTLTIDGTAVNKTVTFPSGVSRLPSAIYSTKQPIIQILDMSFR